jgi:hypothetical protein
MAYHISNLGIEQHRAPAELHVDQQGYVPDATTGPWELTYDHGAERTHEEDGTATSYGEWWASERWPEIVAEAVRETERLTA